jgi:hypothetical protein
MKFNTTSLTFSDVGVAQARQGKARQGKARKSHYALANMPIMYFYKS